MIRLLILFHFQNLQMQKYCIVKLNKLTGLIVAFLQYFTFKSKIIFYSVQFLLEYSGVQARVSETK